uniref:CCHC-type domain-containing protein n=1 Tax=Fagus sylvatica TaxID=28930 RepID=A0A2N9FSP0_FAGSY
MEKLIAKTRSLGWSEKPVVLEIAPEAEDKAKLMLLGKVLSTRAFSRRVWERRPWSFKGEHLILKRYEPDWSLNDIDFSVTDFWVQIHGLPLNRQNHPSLKTLGGIMGKVIDTDLSGNGWKRFVRVRVEIEVGKPRRTGFPLHREKLPAIWIPFKFEKLGNFCYGCGRLGHEIKACPDDEIQSQWKEGVTFGVYGNWLRAETSEFQPDIDLEGLKFSDIAECDPSMGNSAARNHDMGSLASPSHSPRDQAIQMAHAIWEEVQLREPMDQSESLAHENIADTNEEEVTVTAAQERTDSLDSEGLQSHISSPFRKQQELGKDPKRDISIGPTESCSTKPNYSTESTSEQKTPLGLPFSKRKVEEEISPLHPSKKARDGTNSPLTGSVQIKESKEAIKDGRGGGPYHAPSSSMRLLSWNCRGVGRPPTVRAIKALARKEGPDVLFVSETKLKFPKVERLRLSMGFAESFYVDSFGKAGGLALFWKLGVELEVVFSNKNCIAALVYSDPPDNPWLMIGVHGPPYLAMRRKFWRLMEEIIDSFSRLWMLIGDINSIVTSSEKRGGISNVGGSSKYFTNFVDHVGAIDLGFSGSKYTWSNKRSGWANIRERLDRGICNADWQSMFPKAGVKHLSAPNSDHIPILLDTHLESHSGTRPFRFEAMWVKDESSVNVVQDAWAIAVEGSQNFRLVKRLVRRRRNFIAEIKLPNQQWIHSRTDIERYFTDHFVELFQSTSPDIPRELDELFTPSILNEDNANISRIPDYQEVKDVIWSMHPLKAPGPDGEGWLLSQMNHTFITLIPKKQGANNFNQFRPISLCNFYYKIISKILVNRLRPLLPKIIDPSQAAFVPGRWIGENVVLAQEIVHSFKQSKKRKGSVGFKLDFHKAYDSLEWTFILRVLKVVGFDQKVINLIYQCISTIAEVDTLMKCVDKYCSWSGQSISKEKSGMFVSKGVHHHFCRQLKDLWGFKVLPKDVKYLGKVSLGWVVLLSSNLWPNQFLPIQCRPFCLPKGLCADLDAMVRKFWWNPKKDDNKLYTPLAWIKLCRPLSDGGLGFKPFQSFNEALIAKLAWWVLSNRDSFCVRVSRAKYKVGSKWLISSAANVASFVWRGLENVKPLLAQGLVKQLFNEDSVRAILNIPKWFSGNEDKWIWLHSSNGVLTAKSAVKQIAKEAYDIPVNQSLGRIWKTRIHDRLKMHLWRLAADLLPTKDTLTKWSIRTDQFPITNATQLVIMLMSPPDEWGIKSEDKDGFIRTGSLILDQIWKCRNLKVHEDCNASMEHLERRVAVLAVGNSYSSVAIVARDWRGTVVLAVSQKVNTTIPLQAEAEAITWASRIATNLGVDQICIESDSKTCMDHIRGVVQEFSLEDFSPAC